MFAPMEGVMDHTTRAVYSSLGGFDRFVTEFVRVTDKVLPASIFHRYLPELRNGSKTLEGVPVFLQLLGGNPELLAENAHFATQLGACGIDLNFGCPSPTVNRHDGGASLLKEPHRLFDIVSAVRRRVPQAIPVTAKIRLGFSDKNKVLEIAKAIDSAGATELTVHARTRDEGYRPPAHWEFIAMIKEVIDIPVIANGEIWSVKDFLNCQRISGCNRFALARGALATPDLALQIHEQATHQTSTPITWESVRSDVLAKFIQSLQSTAPSPSFVVCRTKQWLSHLGRGYPEAKSLFDSAKRARTMDEILPLLLS